jgi:hypothetical protein
MATATTHKPGPNGKAKLTVSLSLAIDYVVYVLTPIHPEAPDVFKAWRLAKRGGDGAVYDAAATAHGDTCTCPDQTYRHEGRDDTGCKHIQALRLMGLLDAVPTPATEPAPAAPCRPSGEPGPCPPCQTANPAEDAPVSLLDREAAMLTAEPDTGSNPTVDFPDGHGNEAPELDVEELFDADGWIDPAEFPDDPDAGTWELGPDPDGPHPTEEDLAEAAEVFGAMDAQRHLDRSDRLTLDALIEHQISAYESWGNDAGRMFAAHMTELLMRVRWVKAETPDDYDARHEIVEQDARETWFRRGFEEGRQHGRSEAAALADGQID